MHTFRMRILGITAAALLAISPLANAQSDEDLQLMQTFLDIMSEYFDIIESTHAIASDAEKAAILQMQKIQEVYEERGEKARATEMLLRVLENSRNQTIRNAAYIMLGDTFKETGRADEALEYLQKGLDENIAAAQ